MNTGVFNLSTAKAHAAIRAVLKVPRLKPSWNVGEWMTSASFEMLSRTGRMPSNTVFGAFDTLLI